MVFLKQQGNYAGELTVSVTVCIRLVQVQVRKKSSMEIGDTQTIRALVEELLGTDSC